jgi:hypothetical protein
LLEFLEVNPKNVGQGMSDPTCIVMAEKKKESFVVTDRRLFTSDGELRKDLPEEQESAPSSESTAETSSRPATPAESQPSTRESEVETRPIGDEPPQPTAAEQRQQADAYRQSSAEMDRQVELNGHSAKDLEITFERFLASLYMTGMLQLGLMQEQGGQPRLDLIGARQTIDSLSLLSEKTKGNLTPKEQSFLQNALYELRMAYVEVTNAIARGPQQVPAAK